jgi:hypothetical protein
MEEHVCALNMIVWAVPLICDLLAEYPKNWPEILQGFRRRGLQQEMMVMELSLEHSIAISCVLIATVPGSCS